jgi:aspartyl aminopeptidase
MFDNEEVGSGTKQGADSTFLADTLERIGVSCGRTAEAEPQGAVASSFMISADNAHAVHPNFTRMWRIP